MATFKERYEELFGPTPDYDPIQIEELAAGGQRRALDIQASVPDASPRQALAFPSPPTAPQEEQGAFTGLLKTGATQLGEGVVGALEYGARQLPLTRGTAVESALSDARDALENYRNELYQRMAPEVLDLKGREFMTLDPDRTVWTGNPFDVGKAITYKLIEQIPMMAATMLPGAILIRASTAAKGIKYLTASEAGLSLGFIQNEIADGIQGMTDQELAAESPRFAQLLESTDSETARSQFTAEAQGLAPVIGGLMVGAVSAAAGRYLAPVLEGGATAGARFARGAVSEGLIQEGPQESIEQIVGNIAAAAFDGDREALEGAAEAYVQGAVVGGPLGGTIAALTGRGSQGTTTETGDEGGAGGPDLPPGFRGSPTGPQTALPLEGGTAPMGQVGTITQEDFIGTADESLFNEENEYNDVPEDLRAAISANLRRDDKMEDLFRPQTQQFPGGVNQQAESLRAAEGRGTTPTEQGEMFPTAAPTPMPGQTELTPASTEMVPPESNVGVFGSPQGPQGVLPMQLRERGRPTLQESPRGARLPTELDLPVPEPSVDIEAQMAALRAGERDAVYLAPGQQVPPRIAHSPVAAGFVPIPNFDGKGGTLIARDQEVAAEAVRARDAGMDMQQIVGILTGAGTGKPLDSRYAVQQYDENGGVSRESLVSTPEEGQMLAQEWGGNTRVVPAEEAMSRRQELATQDMFNQGRTAPSIAEQARELRKTFRNRTGNFTVTLYDNEGVVMDRDTFDNVDDAEAYATDLYNALPDTNFVEITPEVDVQQEAGPMQPAPTEGRLGGELPPRELARAEAARERAAPTEGEVAVREATADLPFEEGVEARSAAAGSRTRSEAAEKLVGKAAEQLDRESGKAISGFFPPDSYEFNDPKNERRYRTLWKQLVEIEVGLEQERQRPNVAGRKSELNANRKKVLKLLAQVRQLDKPRRTVERKVRVAKEVDVDTVRKLQRNAVKIAQKIDATTEDVLGDLPEMTVKQVRALKAVQLDIAFEQAIQYLEGQDARFDAEAWRKKTAASEKRKLILRALNKRRNKEQTASRVGGTPIITPKASKEGGKTEYLTSVTHKNEETPAAIAARKRRAKTVYAVVAKKVQRAYEKVDQIEVDRIDGDLTSAGEVALAAKSYLTQLTQLAESALATKQDDNATIDFVERLGVALEQSMDLTLGELATLMEKQYKVMEDFVKRRAGTEGRTATGFASRVRTAATVMNRNKDVLSRLNQLDRRARQKKSSLYREFVSPVLSKLNGAYFVGRPYYPTVEEMEGLKFALEKWAGDSPKGRRANFYTPVRQVLTRFGFEFDGDVLTWDVVDGKVQYSPSEMAVSRFAKTEDKVTDVKEIDFQEPVDRSVEAINRSMRERDTTNVQKNYEANRHVRAVALMRRFRKRVDRNPTINQLIDLERKLVADLKAMGMRGTDRILTIRVPGFADISYRLVEPDLSRKGKGSIKKTEAISRIQSTLKDYYTKELKRYSDVASATASDLTNTQSNVDTLFGLTTPEQDVGKPMQKDVKQDLGEFWRDENVLEMQIDELERHGERVAVAGSTMGDLLVDRKNPPSANTVLSALIQQLPENSLYGMVARRLQSLGMPDITVEYDVGLRLPQNVAGRWYPKSRRVVINKRGLGDVSKEQREARAVHIVLHELVHAATQMSLKRNPALRLAMERLRAEMRQQVMASGIDMQGIYALQSGKPVDEFVAEMFSNPKFARIAKQVKIDFNAERTGFAKRAWDAFKSLVHKLLGVEPQAENAFDLVMELESQLFEYAAMDTRNANLNSLDAQLLETAQKFWGKVDQETNINSRVRSMKADVAGKGRWLDVLTMRQMREAYSKYFSDNEGNAMDDYFDAFFGRNAKNAELMRRPSAVSREWTELQDSNPDEALEFSRVGTEATMEGIDPSKPMTHDRNKHLPESKRDKYNELRRRYNALSPKTKRLWEKVTKYYADSIRDEAGLFALNAVRGLVTAGDMRMTNAQFDRKYNKDNIMEFDTKEKLMAEFGDFIDEQMAATIVKLSQVPQLKKGVYLPLMRYGDYAVYAKKEGENQYFNDSKDAQAKAAQLRANDPTATVSVYRQEDGRWVVREDIEEFVIAESMMEAEDAHARLVEKYGASAVGDPGLKMNMDYEKTIGSNRQLNTIVEKLAGNPAAQAAIKNFYIKSLSDQSFRKREANRKNRRGVDYDLQHKNFANYAKSSSYYRAQLEYGSKMGDAMSRMRKHVLNFRQGETLPTDTRMTKAQLQRVYNNLKSRDEITADPQEVSKLQRTGVALTQAYMLTSASYHLINSTQPWMVTLPTMGGKHGWGQAFQAMKYAQKLIKAPIFEGAVGSGFGAKLLPWVKGADTAAERAFNVFDDLAAAIKKDGADGRADEYLAMLDQLRKEHVLEVSAETELRDVADGTGFWGKAMDATRVMAHIVEVNNRVLTAIAAYDLEYNAQIRNGAGREAAVEAATKYATDMVAQTQFDYSTANKPPLFAKAPLVFQFMQWSQHIYAHLVRNMVGAMRGDKDAQKILLGVLGTHMAAGGLIGVTLQPIKMAVGLALAAFGDDREPYTVANALSGATFDRVTTAYFNDMLGSQASTVLSRGLPALLGADLSTRMSLGTLYFIDVRPETPESVAGSIALSFGGAFVNQMGTFYRGGQHLASGDYMKAVESFSPKLLRDVLRAGRFATDGLVNTTGDTVIDTSNLSYIDVALQAVGFTPTTVSEFYSAQSAIKGMEAYVRKQRDSLLKDFRTSSNRGSVIDRVLEFNRMYPQEAITRSTLLRSLRSKAERENQYERYGAAIDDRKAILYEEYGDPYR